MSLPRNSRNQGEAERASQRSGLHVVFLGADGAGKSTVIAEVERAVAPSFRRVQRYHLRPFFGRSRDGASPVTEPHALAPRSIVMSVAKLGLWSADYIYSHFSTLRKQRAQGTLIIFDRYYADLLVDPKRYRYGGPMALARAAGQLVPKPDLVILLDAPAEVLQSRKQEVPFTETVRQRQAYLQLVEGLPNGYVVDAARPLQDVVSAAAEILLSHAPKLAADR